MSAPSSRPDTPDCPRCGSPGASFSTHPCNPPDTPAQEHADTAKKATRGIRDNIGFALAERNIPREPTWTLLVPQALDNIDFALDALLAEVERLKNVLEYTQMRADAQQERAEAAERERDEAQDALQSLAADHYFARAEAAEALAERRETAATLARSELDWCIGYASTVEHKAWRERLLKRLHVARAALADGGDGDGAAA